MYVYHPMCWGGGGGGGGGGKNKLFASRDSTKTLFYQRGLSLQYLIIDSVILL